jgi:hypothetical protein
MTRTEIPNISGRVTTPTLTPVNAESMQIALKLISSVTATLLHQYNYPMTVSLNLKSLMQFYLNRKTNKQVSSLIRAFYLSRGLISDERSWTLHPVYTPWVDSNARVKWSLTVCQHRARICGGSDTP